MQMITLTLTLPDKALLFINLEPELDTDNKDEDERL
jgi:hypothetical protein